MILSVLAACIGSFHFGFHLAQLNSPRAFLQCQSSTQTNCLQMTDSEYSLATAIFAIGGFLGTLGSLIPIGRKPQLILSALVILVGSIMMTFATETVLFIIGRLVVGIGCGLALLNTPVYISEITPLASRGVYGTFSQVAITIGILIASLLGFLLTDWRFIVGFPFVSATAQAIAVLCIPESPKYLYLKNGNYTAVLQSLRPVGHDLQSEVNTWASPTDQYVSWKTFLGDTVYIKLLFALLAAHSSLQLTGINIVFFYSTSILDSLFGNAPLYSLIIAIYNIIATLVSSFIIERLGRRRLILASIAVTSLSQLGLMISLLLNENASAFVFFLLVVTGFAIGLAVVPFILIGELFDGSVVNKANGLANPVNWGANFLVSFAFIPLTNLIDSYVFLIFVGYGVFGFVVLYAYLPETKNISPKELYLKLK